MRASKEHASEANGPPSAGRALFLYPPRMKPLPRAFFERDAVTVARELLGKVVRKGACEGIIVECEAYAGDPASHAVKKPVQGRLMRETYGHWYVYFTYGMHWCANVTAHKDGVGGCLIRAVEPVAGIPAMKLRRGTTEVAKLSTGPACFTQAFGIGKEDNGKPLTHEFGIFDAPPIADEDIAVGPRIGVSHGVAIPWRFYIKGNPYVSHLGKAPRSAGTGGKNSGRRRARSTARRRIGEARR